MRSRTLRAWSALSGTAALFATASPFTAPLSAQRTLPAIRPLGPIIATVHDSISWLYSIRELSDGRVLVNDAGKKRLLLYDATLSNPIPVLDTGGRAARAYPALGITIPERPLAALIPYIGDTTLFVDLVAKSLLVIDPKGAIARVIAPPRPADVRFLGQIKAAFDGQGHLLYLQPEPTLGPVTRTANPILRATIGAETVDTVGLVAFAPHPRSTTTTDAAGVRTMTTVTNPLAVNDDWVVVSDGSVAIVRGADYHVDWVTPAGVKSSSSPLLHANVRLTDSVKQAIVDSVNGVHPAGPPRNNLVTVMQSVPAAELPDYRPAFWSNDVLADLDNRLWIRQRWLPVGGGPVYDVVDRAGEVIDRVQIPGGATIVGFGHGTVYLTSRLGTSYSLTRARLR